MHCFAGEKEGIAISCQELRNLLQNAKELEVRLEGQIKALESRIQDLGAGEEEASTTNIRFPHT